MKYDLSDCKRLVIKVGSALLVDEQSGAIHRAWLSSLIDDIAALHALGKQIVLVSSGAIALGKRVLGLTRKKLALEEKQAAAATGQIQLAHAYQAGLADHHIHVAQVLLTLGDSENRRRYLNARNTLTTLLRLGVIPVINENDTVATSEIRYGDNDRLAARVAQMIDADATLLLSDIDGLYTANPHIDSSATLIPLVDHITPEILAMAGDSSSNVGSGGMRTKIAAAQIVVASGGRMVICSGRIKNPISVLQNGGRSTWFLPTITPLRARKNWLAQHLKPEGDLVIDDGAVSALLSGKSLLAVGVTDVVGDFQKGDPVRVLDRHHHEIARGLSNYAAHEARKIMGKKSSSQQETLGYLGSDEIIHRDDLVVLGGGHERH